MAAQSLTRWTLQKLVRALPLAPSRRFARSLRLGSRDDLLRLGSDYGGHVVASRLLNEHSICYSAGVGDDLSFDLALIEHFGCEVHAFDPTPAARSYVEELEPDERLHFHPHGLWSKDGYIDLWAPRTSGEGAPNYSATGLHGQMRRLRAAVRSLRSTMRSLGHRQLDLLKLDIEGAEYEVVRSIVAERVPINVLTLEFHKDPDTKSMRAAVAELRQVQLFPFHIEGYEVAFVRCPPLQPPAPTFSHCTPGRTRVGSAMRR